MQNSIEYWQSGNILNSKSIKMGKILLFGIAYFVTFFCSATTITVTNTNDSGAGSLRQALTDAANGDTINFSVTGVITISSLLDISKDIVIEGPGADLLAIDGNNSTVLFKDQKYALNSVVISGLELRNGSGTSYGAGIGGLGYNLTLKYCNIHSNTLTASYGAAVSVWNEGSSLTIENCTLHNNSVTGNAACIYVQDGGELNISNSTIYNNNGKGAGQAIYANGSDIMLTNVTIAGHTTGTSAIAIRDYQDFMDESIFKAPSINMVNCIVDNGIRNYSFASFKGGTEKSLGYNISNDNSMTSLLKQTGDLNNTSALLDPTGLHNNGGTTPTVLLQCGSPAIDAGTLLLTLDQTNSVRHGDGPDIGAFESNNSNPDITTTTNGNTIIANNTSATYQWLDCDNNNAIIPEETGQSFTATTNGNYAVEITKNGCVDTSSCVNTIVTGVYSSKNDFEVVTFPNPTEGLVSVMLGQELNNVELILTDIQGKVLTTRTYNTLVNTTFELPEAKGIYLLTISTQENQRIVRLVKK